MKQLSLFGSPPSQDPQSIEKFTHWKIYIDGASRNNPGPSGAGIVIKKNGKLAEKHGYYLGSRTNNQAEYFALLLALFLIKDKVTQFDLLTIISDSQLLIKQFKGEYRIKHPELKPLHLFAQSILKDIPARFIFEHVMREDNTQADYMANHGIDKHIEMPKQFIKMLEEYGIV